MGGGDWGSADAAAVEGLRGRRMKEGPEHHTTSDTSDTREMTSDTELETLHISYKLCLTVKKNETKMSKLSWNTLQRFNGKELRVLKNSLTAKQGLFNVDASSLLRPCS